MCGIAGWYQRDGAAVDPTILGRMTDSLAHRGPDDRGLWYDPGIGLGHRRLAIRDLSELGHQPLADPLDRVVVTYNGEIYNDAALRNELERDFGVRFRSTCDSEVIPHGFLAWGPKVFERLEGMFAIGLWDRRNKQLWLARDSIGIKPLYFAETGATVLFGSEVKALLENPRLHRDIDPGALHTYLAAGHAGPAGSIFNEVSQVPPGSLIRFSESGRTVTEYWVPKRSVDIEEVQPALDCLAARLHEVVGSQLVSDVPLGVLQSGGIDSTLVSLSVKGRHGDTPLFTASFEEKSHDESDLAKRVAVVASLPHHLVPVDTAGDLEAVFRAVAYHFDGQCADTGALAFYLLSEAVRRNAKVVLSGDGADEFFAGYDTYRATVLAERLVGLPVARPAEWMGRQLYRAIPGSETRLPKIALAARFLLGLAAGGQRPHLQWRRLVPRFLLDGLYGPAMRDFAGRPPFETYAGYYDSVDGDVLDHALIADQRFHLQSVLTKVDAMSMAHSLEIRVPLLDRRIMDLAGRLDLRLLHPPGGPPKRILRLLAERLGAPREVTQEAKKGFNVPIARLLHRDLAPLAKSLLDDGADVLMPWINPDGLRRLWREHHDRRVNHAFALWPLLTLATVHAGLAQPRPARIAAPEPMYEPPIVAATPTSASC